MCDYSHSCVYFAPPLSVNPSDFTLWKSTKGSRYGLLK